MAVVFKTVRMSTWYIDQLEKLAIQEGFTDMSGDKPNTSGAIRFCIEQTLKDKLGIETPEYVRRSH